MPERLTPIQRKRNFMEHHPGRRMSLAPQPPAEGEIHPFHAVHVRHILDEQAEGTTSVGSAPSSSARALAPYWPLR